MTRLRHRRLAALLLALAGGLAACAGPAAGPPEITLDRTTCDRCSMLVSEPAYAAAYLVPGADRARVFDDAGCLLAALAEEPAADTARVWLQDALGGGWLEASRAALVDLPAGTTPMGSGVVAFADAAAADELARQKGGERTTFAALRQGVLR